MKIRVRMMAVFFLLFLACLSNADVISTTDSNWYFTEWNWIRTSEYAQSANPGSYFKINFTGTRANLLIQNKSSSNEQFMVVTWSIDDAPFQDATLTMSTNHLNLGSLSDGNHFLIFFIKASQQAIDRWNNGPPDALKIMGLEVSTGSKTSPVTLRPKRILTYWDSIGEGVRVLGASGGDLVDNDARATWAMSLATGMNAEVSMVGWGRQGYTVTGNGNVPPLITPGDDAASAWNKFDAAHYRFPPNSSFQLENQLEIQVEPDYIFCGHGTNDGLGGRSTEAVMQSALAWLVAMRKACPKSTIFLTVPFGGFTKDALSEAFAKYQSGNSDENSHLINLNFQESAIGLTNFRNGGSCFSHDGIHPDMTRDGQLGALLTSQALPLVK